MLVDLKGKRVESDRTNVFRNYPSDTHTDRETDRQQRFPQPAAVYIHTICTAVSACNQVSQT